MWYFCCLGSPYSASTKHCIKIRLFCVERTNHGRCCYSETVLICIMCSNFETVASPTLHLLAMMSVDPIGCFGPAILAEEINPILAKPRTGILVMVLKNQREDSLTKRNTISLCVKGRQKNTKVRRRCPLLGSSYNSRLSFMIRFVNFLISKKSETEKWDMVKAWDWLEQSGIN